MIMAFVREEVLVWWRIARKSLSAVGLLIDPAFTLRYIFSRSFAIRRQKRHVGPAAKVRGLLFV